MKNPNIKVSELAYKELKKKIMGLNSGSYISARQFAKEIGVSYTPVREAFLRLQREGSLKLVPNVGFFVTSLDIADVIQIYQVRECLEAFVLDKVFDRITHEHIDQMKKIKSMQEDALKEEDLFKYQLLDIKFHEILFKIYGNRLLLNLYRDIRDQYMICSSQIAGLRSHDALLEHSEFFDCLESGDKEKAIACIKNHIHRAKARFTDGYITVINES